MSNFPERIWDGCSPSRPNLTDICAPGHGDWCTIITELQATQCYLLDLADNLEAMPNLKKAIEEGKNDVTSFLAKVNKMTPPHELEKDVEETKERVSELENLSKRLDTLIHLVQALQQQLFTLATDYRKFKDIIEKHVQGAENRTRLRVSQFENTVNKRVEELAVRVNEISELLSFRPIN